MTPHQPLALVIDTKRGIDKAVSRQFTAQGFVVLLTLGATYRPFHTTKGDNP